MCGIIVSMGVYRGAESIRDRVLERSRRIRHRGPDWSGMYVKGKNIMAHERLAIVDPENGAQPLFNEAKDKVLAVNGEIYNHKELRKQLKAPGKFMTGSDCEVIIHLYEEEGDFGKVCQHLNGIFGFVLYDEKKDKYMIARDHAGIIPLYWGRDADGAMWIASELKGLHDVCVSFQDFPPGHYYDSETGETKKWYTPAWHDPERMPSKQLDLVELRENLEAAVHRQMMSDVPFGVLLSGGLDSSIISAIAARRVKQKGPDSDVGEWGKLHSFSIGLEGSPDLAAAQKVADHIGTHHHGFKFTIDEGLNAYRDVIYHLETYDVTTIRAATPMYLISRCIKTLGVKMVLSGEGADEMFGGYLYFHKCPSATEMQKELVRKVKGLYKFDCLRANKSTAAWGVEARVPFLDKEFLDYSLNDIRPEDKMCGANGKNRIEKHILRQAFEGYLPKDVLWRQKEQFSDGVGYSWIDSIKARAESTVSDEELQAAKFRFPHNPPATKEAYFIRQTFDKFFPGSVAAKCVPGGPSVACSSATAVLWDESFKTFADCSGRSVLGVHTAAYDEKHRQDDTSAAVTEADIKKSDLKFCTEIASKTTPQSDAGAPPAKRTKV